MCLSLELQEFGMLLNCKIHLTVSQDSGNGKLGLGEFATLWKKIQRYLVRDTPEAFNTFIHLKEFINIMPCCSNL